LPENIIIEASRIQDSQGFLLWRMAGLLGFEPRYAEIKTPCLTAWRQPIKLIDLSLF